MSEGGPETRRLGAFDTDAAALARRIDAHERYGTQDMDPWVMERLELDHGLRVLELGCGTGKQTLPVAEAVGPTGHVTAVDASADALERLREGAARRGLADRLTLREARFDERVVHALEGSFERVVSCYALYYAERPGPLLEAVEDAMARGALLFFCGPSRDNNSELKRFCETLDEAPGRGQVAPDEAVEFMERTGPELTRDLFGAVEQVEFENPLRFDSAEALLSYWSSYNLYDPAQEDAFREAAQRHFVREPVFETVKRMRAVRARKR